MMDFHAIRDSAAIQANPTEQRVLAESCEILAKLRCSRLEMPYMTHNNWVIFRQVQNPLIVL